MKLVEKKVISPPEIWNRSELHLMRNLLVWLEKWISIRQLVLVLFRVFRSPSYHDKGINLYFHPSLPLQGLTKYISLVFEFII